ncbi:MAG: transcriptional regulator [Anaeromicrobium sp.]|uniref:sugar-binding transcriptional regulator n=1 Tax=Anaeromicrobium sp. TaxID=1929132 RepID=UPI0025FAD3FF|nr:sugar-binding domain-containing protein [Anaeromicrobium sp.]MCT4595794.1 transcriptional regulator [Anaeromicrobium sp.]
MSDINEVAKLVEVSKMYYEDNMTQAEIGRKIQVSRPLVSKMLSRAKELGIVKIEIRSLFSSNDLIMGQIRNVFNIKGGVIVPQGKTEYITKQTVLNHSIQYIKDMLAETKSVGLGWGYTIGALVDGLEKIEDASRYEGEICPLIGTANIPNKSYHPNDLVRIFSNSTGLKPSFIYAPAFPTTKEEKDIYLQTENFRSIDEQWDSLDIVIMAVGNFPSVPDQATASRFGKKLIQEKAVGVFLSYYFNKDGKIIKSKDDHVMHISLEKLSRAKKVIAICINASVDAIIGVLRTGFVTHIIMDEKTATEVIMNKV